MACATWHTAGRDSSLTTNQPATPEERGVRDDIQTVILCGGLGTRLREETEFRPKPMVDIGPRPILWHIMKIYAHYGYGKFVLALG